MINNSLNTNIDTDSVNYENAFKFMKDEVDRALTASPFLIREYTEHLSKSTGKFIRAISLLSCAMNDDGLISYDAVKIAASIELLHLATLVHDDIIDNADLRRGELSLQKKYGKRTAVICGDYLLCISLKMAASVSGKEDYLNVNIPDYLSKVCLGELNQHINNGNYDISIYKYLKIIYGKTAALFEASFYAGAILGKSDEHTIKKYAKLGRYIGMIFQLTDDCMDFESTKQEAKKPVQSDYEQNVITLPLIHAFNKMSDFKEKAKTCKITRAEINEIVFKTGGLIYTKAIAKKYYNKSAAIIDKLDISQYKKTILYSILNKAYRISQ